MDRSKRIYGNELPERVYRKAEKTRQKYIKKYGDDQQTTYHLTVQRNETMEPWLGIRNIAIGMGGETIEKEKGVVIGNIRMGFGHYRISMAMASAAQALGYTPYWMDLNAYSETTGGKVIAHLNSLYSLGSRLSQKYALFNRLYWEPLNSEGFRKLSYNAVDQKVSELMTPVYRELPKDIPFIATHVWPAQAAIHAGMTKVVNAVPDNWPMALHLSEGAIHTVQTPSARLGYQTLKGMDGKKVLKPMPDHAIINVGHYVDHELVSNIDSDCGLRLARLAQGRTKRILITVGGAGAQKEILTRLIKELLPQIAKGQVALYINVGDHKKVWEGLCKEIPQLAQGAETYFDNWNKTTDFAMKAIHEEVKGIHAFYHQDIYAAVYATNLLMRSSDIVVTKPSELSFYPVPKLLIKRVGGHEAWGAIRSAEVGDGTVECETVERAVQMLKLMLDSREILSGFNENIKNAKKAGIYDGAYRAVRLAVEGSQLS